jgi:Tol biopolymer transport system component
MLVQPVAGSSTGDGAFSVSTTGVLAYSSGFMAPSELQWIDRAGRSLMTVLPAADYTDFRLSSDDSRLAFSRTDPKSQAAEVWVREFGRGAEWRATSHPLTDAAPLWSPMGDRIIFRSNRRSDGLELFQMRPSPGAEAEMVYSREQQRSAHGSQPSGVRNTDWSPDGKFVIYHVITGETSFDVWALPLDGDRKPIPVARTQSSEVQGVVSTDGRWIAYASDESGTFEIYVQSFPDASTAQKTIVSTGGGLQPRWSKDGRELFYLRSDGMLVSVAVKTQPTFEPGTMTPLFKTQLPTSLNAYRTDYVPAGDGQRFLLKIPVESAAPPSITIVLNWPALLKGTETSK